MLARPGLFSALRLGRYRFVPAEIAGAMVAIGVAITLGQSRLPSLFLLIVLVLAPVLYLMFRRIGFDLEESVIFVAIVGVSIALTLPSANDHAYRNRIRADHPILPER
jgi:hypothetical protein